MKNGIIKSLPALAILCMLSSAAFAQANIEQEISQEVTMQVAITGHECGSIYKVTDVTGKVFRADLGKNGGRMLNKHNFIVIGELCQDENGELIKMKRVEYQDPIPLIEKASAKNVEQQENVESITAERDLAYSHVLSKSHQKHYYTYNVANVEDLSVYKQFDVTSVKQAEVGTKVVFVGSAVSTIKKDELMRFWGGAKDGGFVDVVMNGAYVPLGQRSFVYGTVDKNGMVSLERLDSIE